MDLGEKWRSIFNDRDWIPQPYERLKNLLGSCLNLRDSLVQVEQTVATVESGADQAELLSLLAELRRMVDGPLAERENRLAETLERLNRGALECDDV